MHILVFGKTGQVSRELSLFDDVHCVGREEADLSDPQACAQLILDGSYDAVINAAAYTAVDKAEDDEEVAGLVNGAAPGAMAEACAQKKIPFVHISTDYVFDGTGDAAFRVEDKTGPLGAYGRTKLAGEEAVKLAGGVFGIVRVSWVVSAHGNNFVKTMLRLGADRDVLTIVADQIGGPTPAAAVARSCHAMAKQLIDQPEKSGVYHLSGAPDVSWADFAREIFTQAGLKVDVKDIATSDYPTPAKRPANSRLDCQSLKNNFGLDRPDWKAELSDILKTLK